MTVHDEAARVIPDNLTVEQGKLRLPQKLHAIAIIVIPTIGTLAAIILAFQIGISILDVILFLGLYILTILGISVGYHRHFSHRSFNAATPVRVFLGICGSMAAQGSISYWVSNHRRHHQYTDVPGDIHSPYYDDSRKLGKKEGFFHSHMGWTFDHQLTNPILFAKDLYRDPVVRKLNQLYYAWVLLGLALPAVIGGLATQSWMGALTGFLWGGMARLMLSYHSVNAIDSVTHIFGFQLFETHDHSRNNVWIVLPTLGEGWHNNHHAFPSSARFGFKWWQFDPGWLFIQFLGKLGLAWHINEPAPESIEEKQFAPK